MALYKYLHHVPVYSTLKVGQTDINVCMHCGDERELPEDHELVKTWEAKKMIERMPVAQTASQSVPAAGTELAQRPVPINKKEK